ncbi:MAG: hypothetical protein JW819_08805 [Candidatus Krumholzibacteriota bacterium]|nr:hypothetical protein [Candidatus Krumholzibacteriota bacterium]
MRSASRPGRRRAGALAVLAGALLLAGTAPASHDDPDPAPPPAAGPFWARDGEDLVLDFVFRTQNAGNLALAVSNHGFLGNNFAERAASMEYPKGSEVDHLIRGGLWIGGINTDFDTLVTTGVQDGYWGTYTRPTEFVPVSIPAAEINLGWIRERSTLPNSPYYDPQNAISEQDLVTAFLDTLDHQHTPVQGNTDDWHSASGLRITQESYAWSYEPADAMILVKWTLVPTRTLLNAYLGVYAEMTTGWKGKYPLGDWPPSSANWFCHHYLYWVDDKEEYAGLSEDPFNLVAECHWRGEQEGAPQHAGIKLLGVKHKPAGGEWQEEGEWRVAWRWWDWEPGSYQRDNDVEKYPLLTEDGVDDWSTIMPSPDSSGDSPIQLISVGPWNLYSGGPGQDPDSLVVSVAFLAGDNFDDLVQNALYAQKVYSFNFTVPTPPFSPRVRVEPGRGSLRILWDDEPEASVDAVTRDYDFEGYRLYVGRSDEEASFDLVKQYDLARIPAKNPDTDAYFTQAWLDAEIAADPAYDTEQQVLDGEWPAGAYTYHAGAGEPFLVTEPDSVGYNTGFDAVRLDEAEWVTEIAGSDTTVYKYAFTLAPVADGHHYYAAVTSYDMGNPETPSLESGIGQNVKHVVPGRAPDQQPAGQKVTVFPNPYRGSAVWDANRATGRYVWFAGLPARADIKIFTLAGDLVAEIDFDRDTYTGANAAGVFAGAEGESPPVLPGTMAAWDLLSHNGQPVATGLYLFSVTDRDGGDCQQGKFLVLK